MKEDYLNVINFWFEELSPKQWWTKDSKLDEEIKKRFQTQHHAAIQGELYLYRETPLGRLAEIIILDQFSRNIYRDNPKAFAYDSMALTLAQEMVHNGYDKELEMTKRAFAYLPYMHSESQLIHEQAIELFNQPGMENNLDFEYKHKEIIDRFGRYPHRNEILGRESTLEELEFLKTPGSSF